MKKRIAICVLAALVLLVLPAQGYEYYRYGTYIGSDDIDNDMFLYPYDEDGMYAIEFYLGDTGRSISGTAIQYGDMLTFRANYQGSNPRYTGAIEKCGENEYRVFLHDSQYPAREETFKFCWVAY